MKRYQCICCCISIPFPWCKTETCQLLFWRIRLRAYPKTQSWHSVSIPITRHKTARYCKIIKRYDSFLLRCKDQNSLCCLQGSNFTYHRFFTSGLPCMWWCSWQTLLAQDSSCPSFQTVPEAFETCCTTMVLSTSHRFAACVFFLTVSSPLLRMYPMYPLNPTPRSISGKSYPLSRHMFCFFPSLPTTVHQVSKMQISCRVCLLQIYHPERGTPLLSTNVWRLDPSFPLYVGFFPVSPPPKGYLDSWAVKRLPVPSNALDWIVFFQQLLPYFLEYAKPYPLLKLSMTCGTRRVFSWNLFLLTSCSENVQYAVKNLPVLHGRSSNRTLFLLRRQYPFEFFPEAVGYVPYCKHVLLRFFHNVTWSMWSRSVSIHRVRQNC